MLEFDGIAIWKKRAENSEDRNCFHTMGRRELCLLLARFQWYVDTGYATPRQTLGTHPGIRPVVFVPALFLAIKLRTKISE